MSEEIRRVIIDQLYDNMRGNGSRLLMLCRRLGMELVTLEDVNDELKTLTDEGILEVHSVHRSNTVFILSKVGNEAEQVRRHNLSVGFTEEVETLPKVLWIGFNGCEHSESYEEGSDIPEFCSTCKAEGSGSRYPDGSVDIPESEEE